MTGLERVCSTCSAYIKARESNVPYHSSVASLQKLLVHLDATKSTEMSLLLLVAAVLASTFAFAGARPFGTKGIIIIIITPVKSNLRTMVLILRYL